MEQILNIISDIKVRSDSFRKKVLVFGAGLPHDYDRWNNYFESPESGQYHHALWQTGDNAKIKGSHIIDMDFNVINDLEKLENSYYDLIMFDVSTAKFTKWYLDHIKTIYKKLKHNGKLLVPVESSGLVEIIIYDDLESIEETLNKRLSLEGNDKINTIHATVNPLVWLGQHYQTFNLQRKEFYKTVDKRYELEKKIKNKFMDDWLNKYNKKAFNIVFSPDNLDNNETFKVKNGTNYPMPKDKHRTKMMDEHKYYEITKL